jgi:hypothetical protein
MSTLRSSASISFRSAIIVATTTLLLAVLRLVLNWVFDRRWHANWHELFTLVGILALGWFVVTFLYTYVTLHASARADEILMQDPPPFDDGVAPLGGFVAMEFYALILNRTFVVFIAPEGLYGWKALGAVTASNSTYFQPYLEMLEDPDLTRDREAIRRLSELKGGFFIPRSEIVAVDLIYKRKWGMGAIPHSGRIRIRISSGKSREFVLLGSVSLESTRERILGVESPTLAAFVLHP